MENLWAGAGRRAAVEHTLCAIGKGVGLFCVSEGKIIGGVEVVHLITPGMAGLGKAHIQ